MQTNLQIQHIQAFKDRHTKKKTDRNTKQGRLTWMIDWGKMRTFTLEKGRERNRTRKCFRICSVCTTYVLERLNREQLSGQRLGTWKTGRSSQVDEYDILQTTEGHITSRSRMSIKQEKVRRSETLNARLWNNVASILSD